MSFDGYLRRVMSGAQRGVRAASLRAALSVIEPFYSTAIRIRNRGYDQHSQRIQRLPRPVVSIGNITAGGTGKTPIVRWLATKLRDDQRHVAILARGYKAAPGTLGDEQQMLDSLLNGKSTNASASAAVDKTLDGAPRSIPVIIKADPDRFVAGTAALREAPHIEIFLLDDGFQHRRLGRDLDIVLIDAREPFGFCHVLPRGLLREPLAGLARAGAFVLTHAEAITDAQRSTIQTTLREHNAAAPIYLASHEPSGVRTSSPGSSLQPIDALQSKRVFAFCGIANPDAFQCDIKQAVGAYVGHRWFPDHHAYTANDVAELRRRARSAGANVLVTTEKDWVKLALLPGAQEPEIPIWRLDVHALFSVDDEARLLAQVHAILQRE